MEAWEMRLDSLCDALGEPASQLGALLGLIDALVLSGPRGLAVPGPLAAKLAGRVLGLVRPGPPELLGRTYAAVIVAPALVQGLYSRGLVGYIHDELAGCAGALAVILADAALFRAVPLMQLFALVTAASLRFELGRYVERAGVPDALRAGMAAMHAAIVSPALAARLGAAPQLAAVRSEYLRLSPLGSPLAWTPLLIRRVPHICALIAGMILAYYRGNVEWLLVSALCGAFLASSIRFEHAKSVRGRARFLHPSIYYSPAVEADLRAVLHAGSVAVGVSAGVASVAGNVPVETGAEATAASVTDELAQLRRRLGSEHAVLLDALEAAVASSAPAGSDVALDAVPDAAPDVIPNAAPNAAPDAAPDATLSAAPNAAPNAASNAAPDASSDAAQEGAKAQWR
ncbi:uncharacterized protein AMSG_08239 [Thecamonas trahens ATCC 50062]|uniref:Uncharacterized protein n=1 Tax=Thecamonas trahens ATCC 50062 TaxID=461836 RepID=A0A0L0DHZ1_THETB|nr:hypothetical protein AMSG_08239 [Thecamonas trahens ATCC 50062]KNC51989.1 hypothetical protein AMSG_08239 [Thecamonas trahens ATCC 50062]|eukprot:XP_013755575.1 hypothetical protein AMSG_08239 [Thecamonas trahens ATCC 50062]